MRGALLLCALAVAACDATKEGARAYRAGRLRDALAAFDRAAGDGASPELLYDRALAALALGELEVAESSVAAAAERGGPAFAARRDFVRGNVAFRRSEAAEAEAARADADATARERVVAHAEDALAFWRLAAASREDWPEARRNVERALLRLSRLRERRGDGGGRPRPEGPDAPGRPRPPSEASREEPGAPPPGTPEAEPLPPERILRVLDLLRAKEAEKLRLRRERMRARAVAGERDW